MRTLSSSLLVVVGGVLVAAVIAVGCSTPGAGGTSAGASRGERFFQTKCNSCHPNGGQGAGPPIDVGLAPDFLERGKTSGRHAVPEVDWEPLLGYLNQRFGTGAAVATTTPEATPTTTPAVTMPAATTPATMPATTVAVAVAPAGDAAAGGALFQAKCAKCHPGGSKIAGKAIPGVLVAGGPGKHGVDPTQFDNLLAHLVTLGAVRTGAAQPAAVVAQPTLPTQPTQPAAVATSAGDAAAGGALFQAKCAKCHPGGSKIAGKSLPGALVSGGSGKHGVEAAQFENMLTFLVTLGAVRSGGGPVAAAPTNGMSMVAPPPPPPPPADGTIPMNAGMVPCSCACQCPPGAPPEAMPAACLCQCACAK